MCASSGPRGDDLSARSLHRRRGVQRQLLQWRRRRVCGTQRSLVHALCVRRGKLPHDVRLIPRLCPWDGVSRGPMRGAGARCGCRCRGTRCGRARRGIPRCGGSDGWRPRCRSGCRFDARCTADRRAHHRRPDQRREARRPRCRRWPRRHHAARRHRRARCGHRCVTGGLQLLRIGARRVVARRGTLLVARATRPTKADTRRLRPLSRAGSRAGRSAEDRAHRPSRSPRRCGVPPRRARCCGVARARTRRRGDRWDTRAPR